MGSKVPHAGALYGVLVLLFLHPGIAMRLRVMKTECLEVPVEEADGRDDELVTKGSNPKASRRLLACPASLGGSQPNRDPPRGGRRNRRYPPFGSQLLVRLVVFGKHAGTKLGPGITLRDPHGNTLQEHQSQSDVSFQQSADWPGLYRVCLEGQGTADVDLSLEVLPPNKPSRHVEEEHLNEVSEQVVALIDQLKLLQGEQAYLRSREARQQEVMQSLSSRVINMFLAECFILFSIGLFQLYMVIKFASKKAK